MDNDAGDVCFHNVQVRISCDRVSTCIRVAGNISAQSAVDRRKDRFRSYDNKFFLYPEIAAAPDGYVMNIQGRKSVKNCLSEYKSVSCRDIFSICETVQKLFGTYGADVFREVLFDYKAIFADEEIKTLYFVFVPFLAEDKNHTKCSEFLRILYVHMQETDCESEQAVTELISLVDTWECSGYSEDYYLRISKCIENFRKNFEKSKKHDILSLGGITIRRIAENFNGMFKISGMQDCRITLFCDKKRYSFVYDTAEKCFMASRKKVQGKALFLDDIKIGREKNWANLCIEDMTVSGRLAKIFFKDNKFFISFLNLSVFGNDELLSNDGAYILEDGQELHIGKFIYHIKIQKHAV